MRVFGDPGKPPPGEDPTKYLDAELFAKLVEFTDQQLEDVPVGETDYDKQGKPFPKVVRYTAAPHEKDIEKEAKPAGQDDTEEKFGQGHATIYTEEQRKRDAALWALARSDAAAPLRRELLAAHRDRRVAAFGTQLGIEGLYQERGTQISLANMFFGFRKMAANLIWLEVDRFWHKGQMQRMLPLMKTCVTLDPEFVDAYLLGAWHMAYNATAPLPDTPWELRHYDAGHEYWIGDKETYYFYGVDFLKDGIRKNPRNYKLYFDLGYAIYEEKLGSHVDAIKYLSEAIRLDHDRWVRRTLYRLQGEDEQFEKSKAGWEDYLEWQPDNQTAPRFIKLMEGEIIDRDTNYAAEKARKAEQLAARAVEKGDPAAAAEWKEKAAESRAKEKELYAKSKAFWNTVYDPTQSDADKDSYAGARSLRIEAMELTSQGRYEEAVAALDQARWLSNEFWEQGTELMLHVKDIGNLPLALTEIKYRKRKEEQAEYTRHMPKSIAGRQYRFSNGVWTCTDYRNEPLTPIDEDSEAVLVLQYEHPEIVRVLEQLDGNIILQAGDRWYEYRSKTPAKPSKLNPPPAS